MQLTGVSLQITGTKEVGKLVEKTLPQRLIAAQNEAMAGSMSRMREALAAEMSRTQFTGTHVNAIGEQIVGAAGTQKFKGRVRINKPTGNFVEYGRGPGRVPPMAVLEAWAEQKLGDKRLAFVVARSIAAKGSMVGVAKGGKYPRGHAHMRRVAKRLRFRIRRLWKLTIERALRLAR